MITLAVLVALGLALAGTFAARGRAERAGPVGVRRHVLAVIVLAVGTELVVLVATTQVLVGWPGEGVAPVVAAAVVVGLLAVYPLSARPTPRLGVVAAGAVVVLLTTVAVVAILVASVLVLIGRPEADQESVLVAALVAVVGAAFAGPAARRSAIRITEPLVVGNAASARVALRKFPDRMTRQVPMDELLQQLVELLRGAFDLDGAELWRRADEQLHAVAMVPHRARTPVALDPAAMPALTRRGFGGASWVELWLPAIAQGRDPARLRVVPVLHGGALLGVVVLELAAGATPLSSADEELVVELARQVGLALHNAELDSALQATLDELRASNEELQRSRARVVSAADAERRAIERNLHDGAQQHLVALAVNLRLARDVVADDPEAGSEMLEQLAESVKETIAEVRALAHGIYPPLLVDAGLGEALRAAAARSPLDVTVDAPVGRYAGEIEAAVYFCCLEAMQNAAKHAAGASVVVSVAADGERLRFDVVDDGPGFDVATATAGHGYVNMADRLGAFGGAVEWRSTPGAGATVAGWVPARPRH